MQITWAPRSLLVRVGVCASEWTIYGVGSSWGNANNSAAHPCSCMHLSLFALYRPCKKPRERIVSLRCFTRARSCCIAPFVFLGIFAHECKNGQSFVLLRIWISACLRTPRPMYEISHLHPASTVCTTAAERWRKSLLISLMLWKTLFCWR